MDKKENTESQESIEYKVCEETAEKNLEYLFRYYRLNLKTLRDKQIKRVIEVNYNRLIDAVMEGRLEIKEENGRPVITQHIMFSEVKGFDGNNIKSLNYAILSGKHKRNIANAEEGDMYRQSYLLVGAITGVGGDKIEEMLAADLSLCEVLGVFFLAV